jgi:outer membrane protein assembly factor BamD (BamD/ComL family)
MPDDFTNGNLTVEELVQRAQEASDRNRYRISIRYYEAIRDRYPDDQSAVCGADYEIAFIHYKQKQYTNAKEEFGFVLDRYNQEDAELLPQKYKILAEKVVAKIDLKTGGKLKTSTSEEE